MDKAHKVSFIIVNWNGKDLLQKCLDSILSQTYSCFEIITVDNGSTDGSIEFLQSNYPKIKVVQLPHNYGFTGGNNRGLKFCSGEYIALVNNDVVLDRNWLEQIIQPLEEDVSVGLVSSKIYIKGSHKLDSTGDVITTAFTGTKLGENCDGNLYKPKVPIHGVCAAAAIYRKSMLEDIGFFDDDFFLNYEDTDLNMRAWLSGWKCQYAPEAIANHAVNSTIGTMSSVSVYYFSRNSLLVLAKNIPLRLILRRLPQRLLYESIAFLYYALFQRRLFSYLKGKYDAIKLLPKTLHKRKKVLQRITLSDDTILKIQYPISQVILERLGVKR